VDNSYFELADNSNFTNKVNTDELIGVHLSLLSIAFCTCTCGKIHCIGEEELSTCPRENQSTYGNGDGGFEVNRTQKGKLWKKPNIFSFFITNKIEVAIGKLSPFDDFISNETNTTVIQ
jgi:hypothetical protein